MEYKFGRIEELPVGFNLPVILAGGIGYKSHLASGLADLRADAVANAQLLNFVGVGLRRVRERLVERGYKLAKWPLIDEFTGMVN
jgi:imidazole glycerol phosphate synthase subunit HisF